MSLRRYAEYKDSEVVWLGDVPVDWRVDRLKASIISCRNGIWGDEPTGDGNDIECVRVADFDRARLIVDGEVPTLRAVTEKERSDRLLTAGDLLLEKSGGGEKQPVGQVVLYDRPTPAVCSNFVAKVSLAEGMVPRFWMYQHAAAYSMGVNVGSIKQTSGIQNLDQSQYFNERGVFPTEEEQSAIANFLDRETGKIDALIAEQEKLLTLLAEKRQATISHAVTRGLNPTAPMKDSGVPWLGQVPAHWTSVQLGRLCRQVSDGPHFSPSYVDDGVMFLSARNIRADGWSLDDAKFVSEEDYAEFCKRVVPEVGDVLYTKGGTTGVARVVDLTFRFQVWVHIAVLKVDTVLTTPYFLAYSLNSIGCYEQSQLLTRGATNNDLGLTRMVKMWMSLPHLSEQHKIVEFLDEEVMRINVLRSEAEHGIALLKERRSALIAAAVTGKIDVRGIGDGATRELRK